MKAFKRGNKSDNLIYSAGNPTNQIYIKNSNRCYGLTSDENYLLACEYGDSASDAEIITYKKRRIT